MLIRAIEPVEGIDAMRQARAAAAARRTTTGPPRPPRTIADARIGAGPGLVSAAMSIDRTQTGVDLCDPVSPLRLEQRLPEEPEPDIAATPRIGIAYAGEPWVSVPWRLVVPGSPSLSGARG